MKKLALLSLLLAFTATTATATEPADIGFDVQVTEGTSVVFATRTTLTEGLASTVGMEREVSYRTNTTASKQGADHATVLPGITLKVTPTLETDGRITLDLTVRKTDILSIDTVRENGVDGQRPRTASMNRSVRLSVKNGQPVEVPLGEAQASDPAVRIGQPVPPYVLKLVATRP